MGKDDRRPVEYIAVDLDGTLAEYHGFDEKHPYKIGPPIPKMVKRVKKWLKQGRKVKIFTARVDGGVMDEFHRDVDKMRRVVQDWCKLYIGKRLPVTNVKDAYMIELWDDRARQVRLNTGELVVEKMAKVAMKAGVRMAVRNMGKVQ